MDPCASLVWTSGGSPIGLSRAFAALLNAGTRPFHYDQLCRGPSGAHGSLVTRGWSASSIASSAGLVTSHDAPERRRAWPGACTSPTRWDPYFRDYMTMADVYHYATQHYGHHRRQLTLPGAANSAGSTSDLLPHGGP